MGDPAGLRAAVEAIAEPYSGGGVDKVAGIEARGFVFAAPAACRLGAGLVPIRKKGKLPDWTIARRDVEYGSDVLEMHADAVRPDEQVLPGGDLLATGGTAEAAAMLVGEAGGAAGKCCFVVDLPDAGGRARLEARRRQQAGAGVRMATVNSRRSAVDGFTRTERGLIPIWARSCHRGASNAVPPASSRT